MAKTIGSEAIICRSVVFRMLAAETPMKTVGAGERHMQRMKGPVEVDAAAHVLLIAGAGCQQDPATGCTGGLQHDRNVPRLVQAVLDLETARGADVFQVDASEGGGDGLDVTDDFQPQNTRFPEEPAL